MAFSTLAWRAVSSAKVYICGRDKEQRAAEAALSAPAAVELQWRRSSSMDRIWWDKCEGGKKERREGEVEMGSGRTPG